MYIYHNRLFSPVKLLILLFITGVINAPSAGASCIFPVRTIQSGDVQYEPPIIRLGDNNYAWSYIYGFIPADPGKYQIDFDLKSDLSHFSAPSPAPPSGFLDTVYAILLFRDEANSPGIGQGYDSIPMFNLDANGIFNNHGTLSSSSRGEEWLHFNMVFENSHSYILPGFELFDWNYVNSDSSFQVADVCVSEVPVPSSLMLLISGLSIIVLMLYLRTRYERYLSRQR